MPYVVRVARRWAILAFLFWAWVPPAWAADKGASFRSALESLRAEDLREHVDALASPQLEGREAGTRGGYAAGEYLQRRFSVLGLRGAGSGGGYVQSIPPNFRNVLAILEGRDPERNGQWIVIGAHYDHVGYGMAPGSTLGQPGLVHPGADDNASGVAGVLELARAFTRLPEPPRRSVLFAFWDAEEKGLLGSRQFAAYPPIAREQVVLLVNLDMIGRLRDDRLLVFGTRSAYGLRRLVSSHNHQPGLRLEFPWKMDPNADHYPFFGQGIPVLALHTDFHENYHRPSDTADRINAAGMERIARWLLAILDDVANRDEPPRFRQSARSENEADRQALDQPASPLPERLGVSWESRPTPGRGVRLSRVAAGSAAEKAGLRAGDRILRFAGREVRSDDDLRAAVMSAPAQVPVLVEHPGGEKPSSVTVELPGQPLRWGIVWRVDDAEPGTVILTQVVPGSPAAQAGLHPGDRIYQVNGRDLPGELELLRGLRTAPGPLRLLVERNGQLRIVEVPPEAERAKRAA